MKKFPYIILLSAFLLTGLSACGQTGPLYLPDPTSGKTSQAGK